MPDLISRNSSLRLIIQPGDGDTCQSLYRLGFLPVPTIPQLLHLALSQSQVAGVFLKISQALSDTSQVTSRFILSRSPLDSRSLLVEFLSAQPLDSITLSVRHAWFLKILARQRLVFKYQPIFDLVSGQIVAYECLARARNDEGQYFSGQQLMNAALSMNLIHEFDDLARTTCLESLAQFARTEQQQPTFFINVLPNALIRDPQSLEQNFQQVLDLGLRPQQIVFELTEVETLRNQKELSRLVHQIREWGFGLAIDDLYGNVSLDHYFMEFRPDVIKLDRRLVHGCSHYPMKQVLVKSLVHSAQELGITVLAEGLEDLSDVQFCRNAGVQLGQGFVLARPESTLRQPAEESDFLLSLAS